MASKTNKTSICSIIALEIVDYAKKLDAGQLKTKDQLDRLINHAVVDIAQKDRMIVETDNGATIICSGPLESNLEDALFISLTIRDGILKSNVNSSEPLHVLLGIDTAPVGKVKNKANLVEDGVAEAQSIMRLAKPNQVLVSSGYHEAASKLTQEISEMFELSNARADEQALYAVRLLNENGVLEAPSAMAVGSDELENRTLIDNVFDWTYIIPVLLSLALFFVLYELVLMPSNTPDSFAVEPAIAEEASVAPVEDESKLIAGPEVAITPTQDTMTKPKKTEKKVVKKKSVEPELSTEEAKEAAVAEEETETSTTDTVTNNGKSKWENFKESVKQGGEQECTQAEIAMNQCTK